MIKIILSIFFVVFGLPLMPRSVNAQTEPDCEMIRARASYKCLTGWTDCYYPCTDKTKDVTACYNTCKQGEDECNKHVDADFRACKTAIIETVKFATEEEKQKSSEVNRWIEENLGEFETKRIEKESLEYESYGRTPQMTDQIVKQAQEAWKKSTEGVRFFDEKSFPPEWRIKLEDQLKPGAKIISGEDFTAIFRSEGGSVLYYPNSFGVYMIENTYDLESGEVEVRTGTAPIDIKTINAFIKSRGTHYWVSYDAAKRATTVGVYEGEVEVTTRDGKTMELLPDGDKPGVVVIRQKPSVVKLIVVGGALLATVVGVGYVLRKRRTGKKRK